MSGGRIPACLLGSPGEAREVSFASDTSDGEIAGGAEWGGRNPAVVMSAPVSASAKRRSDGT